MAAFIDRRARLIAMLAATGLFGAAGAQAFAAQGPEAAACRPGASGPALRVHIRGFKARTGDVRVRLYGDDRRKFLVSAGRLKRLQVPLTPSGRFEVCVAAPAPGRYAIAVHHDLDGDGDRGWNDGGGFSRNPRLSLIRPKPDLDRVLVAVGPGVSEIDVTLLYRKGLSIRPAAQAGH